MNLMSTIHQEIVESGQFDNRQLLDCQIHIIIVTMVMLVSWWSSDLDFFLNSNAVEQYN